jgi:hypothetical protein
VQKVQPEGEFITDGRAGGKTEDDICYNVLAREKESFVNVLYNTRY